MSGETRITLGGIRPYVRFAGKIVYSFVRSLSLTYDCRLLYVRRGAGSVSAGGEKHEVTPGSLVWFQSGTPYELSPAPTFEAIAVDFDLTEKYAGVECVLPPVSVVSADPALLHERVNVTDAPQLNRPLFLSGTFTVGETLEKIVGEFRVGELYSREKCRALFSSVVVDIARAAGKTKKRSALFERVVALVAERYAEPLSNEAIAEALGYDSCYLNRLMITYTGQTLHRYVLQYRVGRAVDLLLSTRYPVAEIAERTGFAGVSHFSNACLSVTGARPSDFRKNV